MIHWTVCVVHIIILKVIFGVGKLSSALASASKFCPRPRPRPRRFVLGLGLGLENLSSFNITARDHELVKLVTPIRSERNISKTSAGDAIAYAI